MLDFFSSPRVAAPCRFRPALLRPTQRLSSTGPATGCLHGGKRALTSPLFTESYETQDLENCRH
jgi:hypothetical protein